VFVNISFFLGKKRRDLMPTPLESEGCETRSKHTIPPNLIPPTLYE
jgi:hypothetical protein